MRIEVWKSSQNQEERHIFEGDGANTYVCGYNPTKIASKDVIILLCLNGYEVPEGFIEAQPAQTSIRIKSRNTR